jgi:hypothetical protein
MNISDKGPDAFLLEVTVESYSPSDVPLSVTVLGEPIGNTSFSIKVRGVAGGETSTVCVQFKTFAHRLSRAVGQV